MLAIIPRACSSKLQPLHQGIKIRFRVSITFRVPKLSSIFFQMHKYLIDEENLSEIIKTGKRLSAQP